MSCFTCMDIFFRKVLKKFLEFIFNAWILTPKPSFSYQHKRLNAYNAHFRYSLYSIIIITIFLFNLVNDLIAHFK